MKTAQIRNTFLSWFEERGHKLVPSASLVPHQDPTLFFVNAGMVQFKNLFVGLEDRGYKRATSAQRCLRVSGKHNDLEEVGRTPRHHTLFEMLGNFSFGDYFKAEACAMAWELLTKGFGIDPERLWVTVYEEDDEAWDIWSRQVGVPESRLQRLGAEENFWSMGDTGPCGPCSEIHYDHGEAIDPAGGGPATGSDRYVEIWNLVFMQFEQHADGTRTPLPSPSIDTGMGLERLAAVLQGVFSNYDTDAFTGLLARASTLSGVALGAGDESDVALRVIADHARASTYLIADGVMPSKEDRGYVLRRILRRAIRYGYKLGLEEPFMWKMAQTVIEEQGEAHPELRQRSSFIQEVIKAEEERFLATLERGLARLDQAIQDMGEGRVLPGAIVFQLHDTFGFPLDLTRLIAGERSVSIDERGYHEAMEGQRSAGRAAWQGSGEQSIDGVQAELSQRFKPTEFTGYTQGTAEAEILAILKSGKAVESISEGEEASLVLSATPCYAESGGQVGDHGSIQCASGMFKIRDVQKGPGGLFYHEGSVQSGNLSSGHKVQVETDEARRDQIRLHHTSTHLLHSALKRVLGDHVAQKGSLVEPHRLRFDFAHHKSVRSEELAAIEEEIADQIFRNEEVTTRVQDLDEARAEGAEALFGEKYDDLVRVVRVGEYSTELCGGTHARRTGDIGLFKITSESGVAAGVRRIEAVTGRAALGWMHAQSEILQEACQQLRSPPQRLLESIEKIQSDRKQLQRELDQLKQELARQSAGDLSALMEELDGVKILATELPGDSQVLREEADRMRAELGSCAIVLGSRTGGKVTLLAAVSKDLAGSRLHAGKLIRSVAQQVGGRGGGRPDFAQAGGVPEDRLAEALELAWGELRASFSS